MTVEAHKSFSCLEGARACWARTVLSDWRESVQDKEEVSQNRLNRSIHPTYSRAQMSCSPKRVYGSFTFPSFSDPFDDELLFLALDGLYLGRFILASTLPSELMVRRAPDPEIVLG